MTTSEKEIIEQLRSCDTEATKRYFYGYCKKAYQIYDFKYQLKNKVGLDFYSLAHEYYIKLLKTDFKTLTDKPESVKLSTWMTRGFSFVVLDAIKAYNREFEHQAEEVSDVMLDYVRTASSDDHLMLQVAQAVASHYNDPSMSKIAMMIFQEGFMHKEVAEQLGITPAAVSQRYKKMMEEVVTPFVIENYGHGIEVGYDSSAMSNDAKGSLMTMFEYATPVGEYLEEATLGEIVSHQFERRITPPMVTSLKPGEIFVFGSNLLGIHAGGAARRALQSFGAVMGKGVGIQGQSYAIPTMQGGVETIKPYVDQFIAYAKEHQENHFLVTAVGCGIAGFDPEEIAPLFAQARKMGNVSLPEEFWF